jgi:hypothetical protein
MDHQPAEICRATYDFNGEAFRHLAKSRSECMFVKRARLRHTRHVAIVLPHRSNVRADRRHRFILPVTALSVQQSFAAYSSAAQSALLSWSTDPKSFSL